MLYCLFLCFHCIILFYSEIYIYKFIYIYFIFLNIILMTLYKFFVIYFILVSAHIYNKCDIVYLNLSVICNKKINHMYIIRIE